MKEYRIIEITNTRATGETFITYRVEVGEIKEGEDYWQHLKDYRQEVFDTLEQAQNFIQNTKFYDITVKERILLTGE